MFAKGLPVHITGVMEIHVKELVEGLIKRARSNDNNFKELGGCLECQD